MRVTLCVPFELKEQAKKEGARWDPGAKVWYSEDSSSELAQRWRPMPFRVPFEMRDEYAHTWCKKTRQTYVPSYYYDAL